ncbi:MAG: HDOD domain-containing protein [Spongiibacteraceae bacterium]
MLSKTNAKTSASHHCIPINHGRHPELCAANQPSTFSITTAEHSFYSTLIDSIDDKKPLSTPQKLVISVVEKSLENQAKRIKSIPRLPSVIPRLLHSLRDPDASSSDYVSIINKDPAVSTAVLKLANSVYFNPIAKRVTSIETAVIKLGINGLRTVLSAAVMQPVIQRQSHYYADFGHKLWRHSICCAVACEVIAKRHQLEPFKAYLLGLVHDIGKITLFSELNKQLQLNQPQDQPGYAVFVPLMQSRSAKLSHTIAKDWSLPEDICEALQQQVNLEPGTVIGPYAHVLYQANIACEIYATTQVDDTQLEAGLTALEDMSLPADLFEQLDLINKQL